MRLIRMWAGHTKKYNENLDFNLQVRRSSAWNGVTNRNLIEPLSLPSEDSRRISGMRSLTTRDRPN
jgi:hypothetical protein